MSVVRAETLPRAAEASTSRPRDVGTAAGLAAILALGAVGFFVFSEDLAFLTRLACLAILVLSLDLVVGYCGIATLGQAALYGIGAYAAGILAVRAGWSNAFALLAAGGAFGAVAGLLSGLVVTQARVLSQVVLSIAVVQMTSALVNKLSGLTGGSDGLSGIQPAPLFGAYAFDFQGRTAFVLAVTVLAACYVGLRRLMLTPFGLTCRAIHGDPVRVRAMGGRIKPALVAMYGISGGVAGLGGALGAVTSGVVGLDSVSFERSTEALVMLALGGGGSLWGGLLGTLVFQGAEHVISAVNPFHWLTAIGVLLVAVMLVLPGGLRSLVRSPAGRRGRG